MDCENKNSCPVCGISQADITSHLGTHSKEEMLSYFTSKAHHKKSDLPQAGGLNPIMNNCPPVFIQQNPKMVIIKESQSTTLDSQVYNNAVPQTATSTNTSGMSFNLQHVQAGTSIGGVVRPQTATPMGPAMVFPSNSGTHHIFQAVPMAYVPQQNIIPNNYVVCPNGMYPSMMMPTIMPMNNPGVQTSQSVVNPYQMCNNMVTMAQCTPVSSRSEMIPVPKPPSSKPQKNDADSKEAILSVGDIKVILPLDSIKKEDRLNDVANDLAKALLMSVIKLEKGELETSEEPGLTPENDQVYGGSEIGVYEQIESGSEIVETVAEIYENKSSPKASESTSVDQQLCKASVSTFDHHIFFNEKQLDSIDICSDEPGNTSESNRVTVLGLDHNPLDSTDSLQFQHDEVMSLKASETLADSDSEQLPSPTSDFVNAYHKNFIFSNDPGPSTSTGKEAASDLVDFQAFQTNPETKGCPWINSSPITPRTCKEEVLQLESIGADESLVTANVQSFLPNFLSNLDQYTRETEEFSQPDRERKVLELKEDYRCKASTSGVTHESKGPSTDEEDYDLDYESDSEADETTRKLKDCWKCSTCDTSFKSFKEKLLHSEFRHRDESLDLKTEIRLKVEVSDSGCHECHECQESFETIDGLWNHKIEMLNGKDFCSICHQEFSGRKVLLGHVKTHARSGRFHCTVCKKDLSKYRDWTRHQLQHLGIAAICCKICGKSFENSSMLRAHLRTHTGDKPYKCNTCDKSFSTSQILRVHLLTHMKGHKFECDLCDKDFFSLSSLQRHKTKKHSRKQRILRKRTCFMCPTCHEVFPSEKKLTWHQRGHQRWPNKCPTCGECFVHQSYLTRHIRLKHDAHYSPASDSKDTVQCLVCHKFYKATSMWLHMRIHSNTKDFKCHVCNRAFRVKCNLVNHMWVHAGIKDRPFKCTLCEKSFTRQKFLDAHVRSHKNIRPFTCNECGKSFIYKHNLQVHIQEHSGVKPYVCPHCEKRFYRKCNLQNHVRIHTGETPYECSICRKEFTQKSNYNSHMKAFHADRQSVEEEI